MPPIASFEARNLVHLELHEAGFPSVNVPVLSSAITVRGEPVQRFSVLDENAVLRRYAGARHNRRGRC